jgi:endonuclease YncB( thermonuclease family)
MTDSQLLGMSIKDFKEFNLDGYITVCKVLRIHDPDTMTIGFMFANGFYKKNIRLAKIDAPELHSKVLKESKLCKLGKEYLSRLYLNKLVQINMGPMDKYGRILATIYDLQTNESINDKLLECKFARAYGVSGGANSLRKDAWTESEIDEGIAIAETMGLTI